MASEEIQKLISDLNAWADQKYGRRVELSKAIGVSKQVISDWLTGRSVPSFDKGLKLIGFLKSQQPPPDAHRMKLTRPDMRLNPSGRVVD